MSQIVPTVAVLGAGKTALTIGYRVLNLDGTTYAAFSTTGVAETSVLGTYRVAGGVVVPQAGGYVVFGESGTDYAEATVDASGGGLTAQETADAVYNLAPASSPAAGSLGAQVEDILEDTSITLPAAISFITGSVAASSSDATAAGAITRRRGDSWSIALTIGAITGYTSLWFTAKRDRDDDDTASVVQIKLNSPSAADGLLYVNGAAQTGAALALGSITVTNAATGEIVIALDETVTATIAPAGISYDVQVLNAGNVTTPDSGTLSITADVTRDVT